MPFASALPAWAFMWLLAFAIFIGCKWLTWSDCKARASEPWRVWAYFFAWPGLDTEQFLGAKKCVAKPALKSWLVALAKVLFGAVLLWGIVRRLPAPSALIAGWCGLLGLVFLLHFGLFHLLALAWQRMGIDARPLMRSPIRAVSLGEFWGQRWNSAFNRVVQAALFKPLNRAFGLGWATMGVFLASGLVHELVISVPARAGYGLPILYFLLQGAAVLFERSAIGRGVGLRRGLAGWCFTMAVTAAPAFWLFHPPFITRVIIPFLHVIHAQ